MEILEQILKQNREIIARLAELEKKVKPSLHENTELITSTEIINDLKIDIRTFHRIRRNMAFLFKFGENKHWRARRCDYEEWKKSYTHKSN